MSKKWQEQIVVSFNSPRDKKLLELACFKLFGIRASRKLRQHGEEILQQYLEAFGEPLDSELGLPDEGQPSGETVGVDL